MLRDAARGDDVATAGERCHISFRVDHADLSHFARSVAVEQRAQRFGRALAGAQKIESELSVGRIDEALRRHRADPGFRPRHDLPDGEPVRLNGDADLSGRRVAGDDRERAHRTQLREARLCEEETQSSVFMAASVR